MGIKRVFSEMNCADLGRQLLWDPALLPGLAAWFRFDRSVTHSASAGPTPPTGYDIISSVIDLSPNAIELLGATPTWPIWAPTVEYCTPPIERPSMQPFGLAQYLLAPNATSALAFEYDKPFSCFMAVVYEPNAPAGSNPFRAMFGCNTAAHLAGWTLGATIVGTNDDRIAFILNPADNVDGTDSINVHGSTTLVPNTAYVLGVTYDGSGVAAGVKLYINGVLETNTVTYDTLGGKTTVSADARLKFMHEAIAIVGPSIVFETFVAAGVVAAPDLSRIGAYTLARYGIA